ncbi:mas-related G-protein coupled receptor member H-like, partial [Hirundo rustica]|uniref:mas-related G-protein coupled receptor member H-like n=1 Tax=Hirundo rustica TaxID=43150 RepID=UPI00267284A6
HVTDPGGAALGYGSQRSKGHQEAPLMCTDPLCLLLPHCEQGAAEEPHGPSRDSPSTDSPSTLTTARGHIPLPAQRPSMEVTTVSPSPASPTEWEDLCETHVTNVAIHSVTLLVCLCGLVGNGAVLRLLSLKHRNTDIFHLALADFLFLLFTVPSALLLLVEDVSCSHILPLLYLSFLFQLSAISLYWALFWMTDINNIRDMCTFCCRCNFPERLLWLVYSVHYWAFFSLFTIIPAVTKLCPPQQQEPCQAALISVYTLILLLFVAPMVISSTIKFFKARRGSKKQQPKRRDIVIFLVMLFILLLIVCHVLQQLVDTFLPSEVLFLLNCIHSSIKPFIYFLAGRCWSNFSWRSFRLSLQRVFDEQEEEDAHSNDASMDTGV